LLLGLSSFDILKLKLSLIWNFMNAVEMQNVKPFCSPFYALSCETKTKLM
jgi:hypothetical protein